MITKPKISVIIPIYNVENYLDRCVSSIINQTLKDIEIILVDDGSPDNCPAMCDEYAKKDSRIKVIHKKNGGLGYARNSGLEIATGEYVAFVDSDDFVDTDTYRLVSDLAEKNKLCALQFNLSRFSDESKIITGGDNCVEIFDNRDDLRKIALSFFSKSCGKLDKKHVFFGSACSFLYRRNILIKKNITFYSEREYISEDYIFSYDFLQKAERIGRISKKLYYYRFTPNSLTSTVKLDNVERCAKYSQFVAGRFLEDGYPENSELYAMGYYISRLIGNTDSIISSRNYSIKEKKEWLAKLSNNEYFNMVFSARLELNLSLPHSLYLHGVKTRSYSLLSIMLRIKKCLKSK